MDRVSLVLVIIGALNWGCVGLFRYDFVAALLGGSASAASRVVYTIVGLAGIWCITLFFHEREMIQSRHRS